MIRALALHAALTTAPERYALKVADRYVKLLTEYAQTGNVAELNQEQADESEPGPLEAVKAAADF